jgi:hypothetical protein
MTDPREIDAVGMVRKIRDMHDEMLKDATAEEMIRFYREGAARVHAELDADREERERKKKVS